MLQLYFVSYFHEGKIFVILSNAKRQHGVLGLVNILGNPVRRFLKVFHVWQMNFAFVYLSVSFSYYDRLINMISYFYDRKDCCD